MAGLHRRDLDAYRGVHGQALREGGRPTVNSLRLSSSHRHHAVEEHPSGGEMELGATLTLFGEAAVQRTWRCSGGSVLWGEAMWHGDDLLDHAVPGTRAWPRR